MGTDGIRAHSRHLGSNNEHTSITYDDEHPHLARYVIVMRGRDPSTHHSEAVVVFEPLFGGLEDLTREKKKTATTVNGHRQEGVTNHHGWRTWKCILCTGANDLTTTRAHSIVRETSPATRPTMWYAHRQMPASSRWCHHGTLWREDTRSDVRGRSVVADRGPPRDWRGAS